MATVLGFKGKNHLQRRDPKTGRLTDDIAAAAAESDDDVDDRRTPATVFDPLHTEHAFTLDAAANAENAKCPRYFDRSVDGLSQSWAGEVVWCNPPYSALAAWTRKALAEVASGCPKVVMLLPANRTEQRWWQELIEPRRDAGVGVRTRFLPGRARFGTPKNPDGRWYTSAPFGLVVVTIEPTDEKGTER